MTGPYKRTEHTMHRIKSTKKKEYETKFSNKI